MPACGKQWLPSTSSVTPTNSLLNCFKPHCAGVGTLQGKRSTSMLYFVLSLSLVIDNGPCVTVVHAAMTASPRYNKRHMEHKITQYSSKLSKQSPTTHCLSHSSIFIIASMGTCGNSLKYSLKLAFIIIAIGLRGGFAPLIEALVCSVYAVLCQYVVWSFTGQPYWHSTYIYFISIAN